MLTKWQRCYLFIYETKLIVCLYFSAFVLLFLVFCSLATGEAVGVDLWTVVQMMLACLLIGFGKSLLLPEARLSARRGLLWGGWTTAVTVGFAWGFHWFAAYPAWCGIVFCAVAAFSTIFLWLAVLWDARKESRLLNGALQAYQAQAGE